MSKPGNQISKYILPLSYRASGLLSSSERKGRLEIFRNNLQTYCNTRKEANKTSGYEGIRTQPFRF